MITHKKFICLIFLLVSIFSGLGCKDSCEQFAEKICDCQYGADHKAKEECMNKIKKANKQKGFLYAKDSKFCSDRLEICSCKRVNNDLDPKCGRVLFERNNKKDR